MDRLIYTAMTGAKHALEQQATVSNNLANATTTGFRAQIDQFRAVPVQGAVLPTRAFVVDATTGSDFRTGAISTWRCRARAGSRCRRPMAARPTRATAA